MAYTHLQMTQTAHVSQVHNFFEHIHPAYDVTVVVHYEHEDVMHHDVYINKPWSEIRDELLLAVYLADTVIDVFLFSGVLIDWRCPNG